MMLSAKKLFIAVLCFASTTVFANPCYFNKIRENSCCDWCHGWTFDADYLYWQPLRTNLAYTASVVSVDPAPAVIGNDSTFSSICPDWESGYRLTLTKLWCACQFDTAVRYTHFSGKSKEEKFQEGNEVLMPLRLDPAGQTPQDMGNLTFVAGEYKLDYHVGDIVAGHAICVPYCNLILHPFGGVKIAFIEEEFLSELPAFNGLPAQVMLQKTDMNLYGITFGCENDWTFCRGLFGFFFRGAFSIMYADIDRKYERILTDSGFSIFTTRASTCNVVPGYELAVGVESVIWRNDCLCLDIQVGYDFQGWLIQDFLYILDGTSANALADIRFVLPDYDPNAKLALHGLSARVSLNF